jgi:dienelactone hydrolase
LIQYTSLSGGDDGLHGNQTLLEAALNSGEADWEITRYAGVGHGYTVFNSSAYDLVADARSWESMFSLFEETLAAPQLVPTETGVPTASTTASPTASPT